MNLVPWFPEIAVLAGALALIPALLALRAAPRAPVFAAYVEPAVLAVIGLAVLDGLISARTGASFAVGAAVALAVHLVADGGIESRRLGLFAWGTVLLGLGLVFELFGSAAGLDEGGWRLFAQLVAAFGLGSAVVTVATSVERGVPECADAAAFALAGAVVIASATPFAANRVDGVAFPMLIGVAALAAGAVALVWRGTPKVGLVAGATVVALLVSLVATGLDPVALGLHEEPLSPHASLIAAVVGVVLGTTIRLIDRRYWTIGLVVVALGAFHLLGPFGTAVGALTAMAAVALPSAPGRAATVVTAVALLAASHSGSPLVTPAHAHGWIRAVIGVAVVGGIGVLGRGPRFALLRVAMLTWVVLGPLLW